MADVWRMGPSVNDVKLTGAGWHQSVAARAEPGWRISAGRAPGLATGPGAGGTDQSRGGPKSTVTEDARRSGRRFNACSSQADAFARCRTQLTLVPFPCRIQTLDSVSWSSKARPCSSAHARTVMAALDNPPPSHRLADITTSTRSAPVLWTQCSRHASRSLPVPNVWVATPARKFKGLIGRPTVRRTSLPIPAGRC